MKALLTLLKNNNEYFLKDSVTYLLKNHFTIDEFLPYQKEFFKINDFSYYFIKNEVFYDDWDKIEYLKISKDSTLLEVDNLHRFPNVKELDYYSDDVNNSYIEICNLSKLEVLNITSKHSVIISHDFRILKNLKELRIKNVGDFDDKILYFNFKLNELEDLKVLNLSNFNLTNHRIPFNIRNIDSLIELTINCPTSDYSYKLESLDGIETFSNLKRLNVSSNNLTNLNGIENCKDLEEFIACFNDIQDISALKKCKNLYLVDLAANPIDSILDIFKDMKYLESLDLTLTNLDFLDCYNLPNSLEILICSTNNLHGGIINLDLLTELKKVKFKNCNLSSKKINEILKQSLNLRILEEICV